MKTKFFLLTLSILFNFSISVKSQSLVTPQMMPNMTPQFSPQTLSPLQNSFFQWQSPLSQSFNPHMGSQILGPQLSPNGFGPLQTFNFNLGLGLKLNPYFNNEKDTNDEEKEDKKKLKEIISSGGHSTGPPQAPLMPQPFVAPLVTLLSRGKIDGYKLNTLVGFFGKEKKEGEEEDESETSGAEVTWRNVQFYYKGEKITQIKDGDPFDMAIQTETGNSWLGEGRFKGTYDGQPFGERLTEGNFIEAMPEIDQNLPSIQNSLPPIHNDLNSNNIAAGIDKFSPSIENAINLQLDFAQEFFQFSSEQLNISQQKINLDQPSLHQNQTANIAEAMCLGFSDELINMVDSASLALDLGKIGVDAISGDIDAQKKIDEGIKQAKAVQDVLSQSLVILAGPSEDLWNENPEAAKKWKEEQQNLAKNISDKVQEYVKDKWDNFLSLSPQEQSELIAKGTGHILAGIVTGGLIKRVADASKEIGPLLRQGKGHATGHRPNVVTNETGGSDLFDSRLNQNKRLGLSSKQILISGEIPGVRFEGRVYRSGSWEIHPGNLKENHRYTRPGEGAVYTSTSRNAVEAELDHWNVKPETRNIQSLEISQDGMLDLTNARVRENLGVSLTDLTNDGYSLTQQIGSFARGKYTGIIAPSARSNNVNIIFFKEIVNE